MKKVTDPESEKYLKITALRGGFLMFYLSCMTIEGKYNNAAIPRLRHHHCPIIVGRVVVVKGLSAQRSRG